MCGLIPPNPQIKSFAGMAELADALDSGSSGGNFVKVQVLLPAPMREWRNWQTRTFEGRVVYTVRVQVPFLAPGKPDRHPPIGFFCRKKRSHLNPSPNGLPFVLRF